MRYIISLYGEDVVTVDRDLTPEEYELLQGIATEVENKRDAYAPAMTIREVG